MFFPKLRRRAKWVFLFLAIAFAGSFVFFGVGAGGSGIGDYLSDLLNRPVASDTPSLDDARQAVQEKPNNAEARLELARAAQLEGEFDEAIAALERYRTMRPEDADALRTLASLYGQKISEAQDRSDIASNEAAEASLPKTFAPEDSPFLQEILGNEITDSVSAQAEARANAANAEVQSNAILQQNVLADLTELVDDEPLLLLQYAQAAETAQDYPTAITAYEDFLKAAPNNPNAELIEQRVESLKVFAGLDQGGTGDGAAGGTGNSGSDGE
jgi:tetratricopeptide (TPR) repeat protein